MAWKASETAWKASEMVLMESEMAWKVFQVA